MALVLFDKQLEQPLYTKKVKEYESLMASFSTSFLLPENLIRRGELPEDFLAHGVSWYGHVPSSSAKHCRIQTIHKLCSNDFGIIISLK